MRFLVFDAAVDHGEGVVVWDQGGDGATARTCADYTRGISASGDLTGDGTPRSSGVRKRGASTGSTTPACPSSPLSLLARLTADANDVGSLALKRDQRDRVGGPPTRRRGPNNPSRDSRRSTCRRARRVPTHSDAPGAQAGSRENTARRGSARKAVDPTRPPPRRRCGG